jgi:hypothetical protein
MTITDNPNSGRGPALLSSTQACEDEALASWRTHHLGLRLMIEGVVG